MTAETVVITSVAAGGDGVGRLAAGRVVFVPRTAPGERVRLRDDSVRLHKTFARAEPGQVLEAGQARVEPACPHYEQDRCGGCQLQHLAYEAQLAAKRTIVGDALRRIARLDVPDPEIVEATEEWRYRTTVSLTVRRRRGAEPVIGFHPYDRPGHVFSLVDCHVADARLMDLWRALKPHAALLPERATRLILRLDRDGGRHVIVESAGAPWREAETVRRLVGPPGAPPVCWWHPAGGAPRVVAGPETGFPATAFEQVHPDMEQVARAWAVDALGEVAGRTVWDLYGGVGDTAARLAARGAVVVSVDADERAVAWARTRTDAAGVRFVAARAEDAVRNGLPEADAVIVSPPRAGLHWDVTLRLTGAPVRRLAYISCDPATLARDVHRMAATYRLASVRAFDLFPQTAHVETVAVLERA